MNVSDTASFARLRSLGAHAALAAMLFFASTIEAAGDASPAGGEEGPARPPFRNTLSTNPVRYALLHFQIEYERVAADRFSFFVAPLAFHHAHWYPFAHADHVTANGFGLDLGFRFFVVGAAPAGAFVGPYLSGYRGYVLRDDAETRSGYVFSPGAQAGYSWLLGRLLLSLGGGLSYGIATELAPEGSPRAYQLPHRGFWLNFRANIGFAF